MNFSLREAVQSRVSKNTNRLGLLQPELDLMQPALEHDLHRIESAEVASHTMAKRGSQLLSGLDPFDFMSTTPLAQDAIREVQAAEREQRAQLAAAQQLQQDAAGRRPVTRILVMQTFEEPSEPVCTRVRNFVLKSRSGATKHSCEAVRDFMNALLAQMQQQYWPRLTRVIKAISSAAPTDEDINMLQSVLEEALQTVVVGIRCN